MAGGSQHGDTGKGGGDQKQSVLFLSPSLPAHPTLLRPLAWRACVFFPVNLSHSCRGMEYVFLVDAVTTPCEWHGALDASAQIAEQSRANPTDFGLRTRRARGRVWCLADMCAVVEAGETKVNGGAAGIGQI